MLNADPRRVFEIFQELDFIPRPSGGEKQISDYILSWAKERGLAAVQDEFFNVVIKKPASQGRSQSEPVILQAHMDMVCEKTPESTHDFSKDPIILKTEGDWVVSDCGTSIGADNGVGVALSMAILEDNTLQHPPLEVIFTTDEECTFKGAAGISPELFTAKRLINLDNSKENEVLAGSCGGRGMTFSVPMAREQGIPEDGYFFKVSVSGMEGGHSGMDIHKGRGSALELITRFLRSEDISLCSVHCGAYRLAIPRDGTATVMVKDKEAFLTYAEKMTEIFKKEYKVAAPELTVEISETEPAPVFTAEDKQKLIAIVDLFPNEVVKMNGALPGMVESSNNVGTMDTSDGKLVITAETRGSFPSTVEDILDKVRSLAALTGAKVEFFGGYGSWEYNPDSPLRLAAQAKYREMFGEELKTIVAHAGIECAMFTEKVPEMDAIVVGPNCEYFHSPNERVSISSTGRIFQYLKALLAEL